MTTSSSTTPDVPPPAAAPEPRTPAEVAALRAKREELLTRHLLGETRCDAQMVLDSMVDPPTYELVSIGLTLVGREQVGRLLETMFGGLPGIVHRAVRFHHADDAVIVETETDFPDGLDGSTPGEPAIVRGVGVFPFDGERSLGEKVYVDMGPLLPYLDWAR
jgi:hypothetical protein